MMWREIQSDNIYRKIGPTLYDILRHAAKDLDQDRKL